MSYFKKTPKEKKAAEVKAKAKAAKAALPPPPPEKPVEFLGPPVVIPPKPPVEPPKVVTPFELYEVRLKALELLVALQGTRMVAMQEIPAAHDARLTALETLVRSQVSDIISRATELASAATLRRGK